MLAAVPPQGRQTGQPAPPHKLLPQLAPVQVVLHLLSRRRRLLAVLSAVLLALLLFWPSFCFSSSAISEDNVVRWNSLTTNPPTNHRPWCKTCQGTTEYLQPS
jgi:hypothetical protein